eukprot:jgi/Botrbrau1/6531/Bobra.40_2s0004.1
MYSAGFGSIVLRNHISGGIGHQRRHRSVPRAVTFQRERTWTTVTERNVMSVFELSDDVQNRLKEGYLEQLKHLPYPDAVVDLEEAAFSLLKKILPYEVQEALRGLLADVDAAPVVAIKGFPLEDNLPPALAMPVKREEHLFEAMMLGMGRFWGYCTNWKKPGKTLLIRDYVPMDVEGPGTHKHLSWHSDYPWLQPHAMVDVSIIFGVRQDKARAVKTGFASNLDIYRSLTSEEIQLLRSEPVQLVFPDRRDFQLAPLVALRGAAEDPEFHVSNFDVPTLGPAPAVLEGENEEVKAAYLRIGELASQHSHSIALEPGMFLINNNRRTLHCRTAAPFEPDGMGRWIMITSSSTAVQDPQARYLTMDGQLVP